MASVVHIRATHADAAAHAAATKDFQQGLSAALARLAKQPTKTVAVVATYYGDYEPAYAVLNELGRRTDYRIGEYLIVEHYAHGINPLLDQIEQISEQGAPAWRNRPLRGLPARDGAMCIFLNQDPVPLKGCRPGAGLRIVAVGT